MFCKLCLGATTNSTSFKIGKKQKTGPQIAELITSNFDVAIELEVDIICFNCWQHLKDFYDFSQKIVEKQKNFKKQFLVDCGEESPKAEENDEQDTDNGAMVHSAIHEVPIKSEVLVEEEFVINEIAKTANDGDDSMAWSDDDDTNIAASVSQLSTALSTRTSAKKKDSPPESPTTFDDWDNNSGSSSPSFEKFTIVNLVPARIMGTLNRYYKKHNFLGSTEQNMLARVIVENILMKQRKIKKNTFKSLARQIKLLFPNEDEHIYYEPADSRKKCRARGKLLNRYMNSRRILDGAKAKKQSSSDQEETETNNDTALMENALKIPIEDIMAFKSWLRKNLIECTKYFEKWKATSHYRLMEFKKNKNIHPLSHFIEEWPGLQQEYGGKLISIDFNCLYPNKEELFWKNWNCLISAAPTIFTLYLKDTKLRKILADAKNDWSSLSRDSKDSICLWLLHGCVKPSKKHGNTRITIADSQNSVLKFIDDFQELSNLHATRPLIAIVGNMFEVKTIYVILEDGIKYKVESVAKAFLLLFSIFHVFYLDYPIQSEKFWIFLQREIFCLKLAGDDISAIFHTIGKLLHNR